MKLSSISSNRMPPAVEMARAIGAMPIEPKGNGIHKFREFAMRQSRKRRRGAQA